MQSDSIARSLDVEGRVKVTLTINGRTRSGYCEPRTTLGDFIRHQLGLTGTHLGCEHGVCGACTISVNGEPIRACLMFAYQAHGSEVLTVEGLSESSLSTNVELTDLQLAFKRHHALQCGFCTPGFLITCEDFLKRNPSPTEQDVREAISGNLCRCTGYQGIVAAVLDVANQRRSTQGEFTC